MEFDVGSSLPWKYRLNKAFWICLDISTFTALPPKSIGRSQLNACSYLATSMGQRKMPIDLMLFNLRITLVDSDLLSF